MTDTGNIKSLDKSTVHRICSGQVIINLANAVKELIENSIDAGAKNIEIRLKNYGSELIEVIDDGPGIDEADFQTITLKHYTSKIQKYDDLECLDTFGFRGEALSSLCSLSNLFIVTRNAKSTKATKIEYDQNGMIRTKTSCARSVGTTVQLEKLFYSLPVRHKEFLKNLKKDYHKLLYVVQSYCLISEGIKLSLYHVMQDKSTKLMSTQSKNNLKDNIIEIFGSNSMSNMVAFDQCEPDADILSEFKISKAPNKLLEDSESLGAAPSALVTVSSNNESYSNVFKIDGYVSDCGHGCGRSAADRQYFYVNRRPCDHSKITKLINEIFHQFNRNQYPMFVLNIVMDSKNVDVNVTPDKLQMFFKNENILLAIIKSSLLNMYTKSFKNLNLDESSFQSQKSNAKILTYFSPKITSTNKMNENNSQSKKLNLAIDKEISTDDDDDDSDDDEKIGENDENGEAIQGFKKDKKDNVNKRARSVSDTSNSGSPPTTKIPKQPKLTSPSSNSADISSFFQPKVKLHEQKKKSPLHQNHIKNNAAMAPPESNSLFNFKEKSNLFHRVGSANNSTVSDLDESMAERIDLHLCNRQSAVLDTPPAAIRTSKSKHAEVNETALDESTLEVRDLLRKNPALSNVIDETCEKTQSIQPTANTSISSRKSQTVPSTADAISNRKTKVIEFSVAKFFRDQKAIIDHLKKQTAERECMKEKELIKNLKFKSKNIESKDAETELDRCMTKSDFLRMNACGQFNKGFIVGELDSDLFIVDQHAADEIYNFEQLQKGGKIDKQKLLQPKYLELSPSAEHILKENISFLEKSGYELQICTNRKIGNQIMLTCVPMSAQSNKLLDLKDIDELIFVLSENDMNTGSITTSSSEQSNLTDGLKSSSLRAFYASKACRKSIMIGDSLNMKEMKRVINHLSEIDKPWNCPHGRPTMRHLINIELLRKAWKELEE